MGRSRSGLRHLPDGSPIGWYSAGCMQLRHVSPIEWKKVILYGKIKFDPEKLPPEGRWRQSEICDYSVYFNTNLAIAPRRMTNL